MLAGVPPFYGDGAAETFEAVLRGILRFPTKIFRSVSPEAKDLLRKMICRDASRRLSAEQVLRHLWIINGGETSSISGGFRRLQFIPNARVPIVKFEGSFNISCDISVNNLSGQMKSKILFWISSGIDQRFRGHSAGQRMGQSSSYQ